MNRYFWSGNHYRERAFLYLYTLLASVSPRFVDPCWFRSTWGRRQTFCRLDRQYCFLKYIHLDIRHALNDHIEEMLRLEWSLRGIISKTDNFT